MLRIHHRDWRRVWRMGDAVIGIGAIIESLIALKFQGWD
jgi:hypothetical protein